MHRVFGAHLGKVLAQPTRAQQVLEIGAEVPTGKGHNNPSTPLITLIGK